MTSTQIVTSIGLSLDIAGALLVAKDYWHPQVTSEYEHTDKKMLDSSAQANRVQEQIRNYPYAKCGLLFLISGFIIQFIAQLL
ncbi:MAG: hypothetical protein AABZ10_10710 [Nitrospirota bacterium]